MSFVAVQLQNISAIVGQYYLPSIFVLGITGNLITVMVFSGGTLRKHNCSWYLISGSIAQSFVLLFGCLTRIVILLTGFDWTASSLLLCKCRTYLLISATVLFRTFLCLVAIDRWMVSSLDAHRRRQSTLRLAQRLIVMCTVLWLLFNIHVFIGFRLERQGCGANSETIYLSFFTVTALLNALVPFALLTIFMILTLSNVTSRKFLRRADRAIHPNMIAPARLQVIRIITEQQQRRQNRNNQLIRLGVTQVFVYMVMNLPNTAYVLYTFITETYKKESEQIMMDSFVSLMATNLLYTYCGVRLTRLFHKQQCARRPSVRVD